MKSRFFKKSKIVLTTIVSILGLASTSSCSSFFGGSDYTISNVEQRVDSETGDTIVIITFENEEIAPLTFRIPTVTNGVGIESITSVSQNNTVTLKITYTDGNTQEIRVPIINGVNGKDGVSVTDVAVTPQEDGSVTIQFFYSDGGESEEFLVPKGDDGVGIADIVQIPQGGGKNIIKITFTDPKMEPKEFLIQDGVSITSIEFDEENSTEEEYVLVVNFSNNTQDTFSIPRPIPATWLSGKGAPNDDNGRNGDFYLDSENGFVYKKNNGQWEWLFSMKNEKESVTVSFNLRTGEFIDGQEGPYAIKTRIDYNSTVDLKDIPVPTKNGYEFIGWYASDIVNINAGKFTNLTIVTSDINLYAWWSEAI